MRAGDRGEDKSYLTQLMLQTRSELEEGRVPLEELEEKVAAWRFRPQRIEKMVGGPDTVMWDRYEWRVNDEGAWEKSHRMIPH